MAVVGTQKRNRIWKRDGMVCRYCGCTVIKAEHKFDRRPKVATIDHVTPSSRGGTDEDSNLVTACRACNEAKGDRLLEELGWSDLLPPVPAAPAATEVVEPISEPGPLITEPGAYPDIAAEDYHGNAQLLPGPSLSSSGAKLILGKSPFHFWWDSPLNPDRPEEDDKPHFSIGRAAHDMLLLTDRWPEHYHVLPDGYSAAKTKQMPDAIAEAEAARKAGKTILKQDDADTVRQVAAAIRRNSLAVSLLTNGVAEETLAWKDPETGVWLRARPDFRPHTILTRGAVMAVPDLKFMAPSNCGPVAFGRAINNFGYHQSAAFYMDGIKAVYGHYPTHWVHVAVEKEPPHCVALYELPGEDIERGRWLNRIAIRKFAECLNAGKWPGYADEPKQVGLPVWARMQIENGTHEAAWSEAA